MYTIGLERFIRMLIESCTKETTVDPNGWSTENPTWGHCAIITVLTQDFFGGTILRSSLLHVPEFATMRSHYVNRLDPGILLDITAPQFGDRYPPLHLELSTREYILSNRETFRRYGSLRATFLQKISDAQMITHT